MKKSTYKQRYKKRLIFNIPEDVFERLRKMASVHNITMTTYTLQALLERIMRDEQYN